LELAKICSSVEYYDCGGLHDEEDIYSGHYNYGAAQPDMIPKLGMNIISLSP
jgi:hypothetical protein